MISIIFISLCLALWLSMLSFMVNALSLPQKTVYCGVNIAQIICLDWSFFFLVWLCQSQRGMLKYLTMFGALTMPHANFCFIYFEALFLGTYIYNYYDFFIV